MAKRNLPEDFSNSNNETRTFAALSAPEDRHKPTAPDRLRPQLTNKISCVIDTTTKDVLPITKQCIKLKSKHSNDSDDLVKQLLLEPPFSPSSHS